MNKALRIFLVMILFGSMIAMLQADNNHAQAYIRMGVGARALAMGSAATASIDDVSAAYWNPAGLANMKGIEFSSMYTHDMGIDRNYNYAALGMKFNYGTVAVSWINANMADFDKYTADGTPNGTFDVNDHSISISYATTPHRIKLGFTGKMYMSDIDTSSESGYGFDIGAIYDVNDYMSMGIVWRDAYSEIADEEVPYQLSFGASIFPYRGITIAADFKKEESISEMTACFGAEYWTGLGRDEEVNSQLSGIAFEEQTSWEEIMSDTQGGVRVGLNDGNFTGGLGLRFKMFEFSYAYEAAKEDFFNDIHRFSLTLKF